MGILQPNDRVEKPLVDPLSRALPVEFLVDDMQREIDLAEKSGKIFLEDLRKIFDGERCLLPHLAMTLIDRHAHQAADEDIDQEDTERQEPDQ